jgi:hypothetical protein
VPPPIGRAEIFGTIFLPQSFMNAKKKNNFKRLPTAQFVAPQYLAENNADWQGCHFF